MNARSILLTSAIIMMLGSEGNPQLNGLAPSLETIGNFLFTKEPGIVRVRKMEDAKDVKGEPILDFIGLVEKHGYSAEEHNITTNDGYNLKIHRIPASPLSNNTKNKKVVFMQHGNLGSSDCWVLFGPNKDLAFLLADEGYDVWFGNYRGNTYCRSHLKWSTYDREFWDYSFHEIAMHDLPNMIDYVLNNTGQDNLHYIGHSMGTTTLLVLLSMKPEYNSKIKLGTLLTPVALASDLMPIIKEFSNIMPRLQKMLDNYEIYDCIPLSAISISIGRSYCSDNAMTQPLCIAALFLIVGSDPAQLNTTALPFILSYSPAGTSLRTFYQYLQNNQANKFQSYDYGAVGNYKRYKQKTPIIYDLSKISAPIAIYYGLNDRVVTPPNVRKLAKLLPNLVLMEAIAPFNHIDVLWAIDAKVLLFDRLIQLIHNFDIKATIV